MKWTLMLFSALVIPAFAVNLNCMNKAMTQTDMNICSRDLAVYAEQKLSQLVTEINQKNPAAKPKLTELMAAWRQYRESECDYETAAFTGGSIYPLQNNSCYTSLTWQQIKNLKYQLCDGGDLGAVCAASHRYDMP